MTGVERLERYVNAVLGSPKNYPLTVRQACQRFVDDIGRDDVYFDIDAANAAIQYVELLPHTKGEWQYQPTVLEDFQCFWVGSVFGWKWQATGLRRFRYVYVQIPRKNGKTHVVICIALVMFGPDNEPGAEVYLGATSQQHCKKLLYKPARFIVDQCEEYREAYGAEAGATTIVRVENNSMLTTVIKKPDDGDSPHCAVVDEYHEHETSDQYDTFDTGMGARRQPLLHVVTTAGGDLGGPCYNEYLECKRILRGEISGDSKFILIFEPDEDDEWTDPAVLRKVNPNMGISVAESFLLDQLEIAKRSPAKQNTFRTKHLNQWVGAKVAWMNMLAWQRQQKKRLKIDDFRHQDCHLAVDLASKKDVAAIYALFRRDGEYFGFPFFYAPESAAEENDRYPQFVNRDELVLTDGNMTDYAFLEEKIKELAEFANVISIAFDPYQASYMITRLMGEGLPVVEYGQNVKNMSAPMKEVDALVADGKFWHDGNTCMTWMMSNVTAKVDVKENIYPNKANRNDEHCKIDGVVAMIMAMGRWLDEKAPDEHAYTHRGFRTL